MGGKFTKEDQLLGAARGRDTRDKQRLMKEIAKKLSFMSPKELEVYEPENGLEYIHKIMILKCETTAGKNAAAIWKEIKETVGERIGSNWKETKTHNEGKPDVILDLPTVVRSPELEN